MSLKDKIHILLENGFSYNQLGQICECHPTTISKWMTIDYHISKRMEESIEKHIQTFIQKLAEIWK